MTGSPRPNLGGLFNGSVPPERPRRINGVPGPTLSVAPSRPDDSVPAPAPSAAGAQPASGRPAGSGPDWLDPVNAVEQYFALLRGLLDINRDIAVAVTRVMLSLPQRVGLRR